MISDSAERLSCTEGGTGSRNKPGLIDSEVAAAPPPQRLRPSFLDGISRRVGSIAPPV